MYNKWWWKLYSCTIWTTPWKLSTLHCFDWGRYVLNVIDYFVHYLPLSNITCVSFCWKKNILRFILSTFIVFTSILELCTYQRKSDEEETVELFLDDNDNQHIREYAENYKGEMLTQPLEKNKNMIYQGMYENQKNCLWIYQVYKFNWK